MVALFVNKVRDFLEALLKTRFQDASKQISKIIWKNSTTLDF